MAEYEDYDAVDQEYERTVAPSDTSDTELPVVSREEFESSQAPAETELPVMSREEFDRQQGQGEELPVMSREEFDQQHAGPKAETPLWTGLREAAHNVLPTLAAIGAGAATGAAAGSVWPGVGTIGGALIGGGLAAYGVSEAQEAALKALDKSDIAQREANIKENPWSAAIGGAAPGVLGLRPGAGAQLANRALSAGMNVLPEAAQQAVTGNYSPESLVTSAVAGAALPNARGWVQNIEKGVSTRLGVGAAEPSPAREAPPGRPDQQSLPQGGTHEAAVTVEQGTPGSTAAAGTSEIGVRPDNVKVDDQSISVGSERNYGKDAPTEAVRPTEVTEASPEIKAALDALNEKATPVSQAPEGVPPSREIPGINQDAAGGNISPAPRQPLPENIPTDPAVLRRYADNMGDTPRARQFRQAADLIEQEMSRQRPQAPGEVAAEPVREVQQAQQGQPPAGGGPPGGGLTPTGGQRPPPGPQYTPEQALEKTLSRVGEQPKKGWFEKGWLNDLYTAAKDKFHEVERTELAARGGTEAPFEESPYKQLRMTEASGGVAQSELQRGIFDRQGNKVAEGLFETLNSKIKNQAEKDKLDAYLLSKSVLERDARGFKTGFDIHAERQNVQNLEAKYKPIAEEIYKFEREQLKGLVDDGLVSQDAANRMLAAHLTHVPLQRVMDPQSGYGTAGSLTKAIRAQKGSEEKVISPLQSIVENHFRFQQLRAENRAMQTLERFAQTHPNAFVFEKKAPSTRPISVTPAEINKHLADLGLPGNVSDAMTIFRPNSLRPKDNQVVVMKDGKPTIYETDPKLAAAYKNMDSKELEWWQKIMAAPARTLRAGVTTSPEFALRNPMRDQLTALATSKNGYVPFWDMARGLVQTVTKGEQFKLLERHGAFQSALVDIDRNYMQMNVDALERRLGEKIKNVLNSPLEGLRKVSEALENATRTGEGMRALEKGLSPQEAAWHARNLMDYSQMGSQMKALQSMVPFLGAQLVGLDRAGRAFKENPKRFLTMMGTAITAPSVALWAANKDDPRYKEAPRWEKDLFWLIMPGADWKNIDAATAAKLPNDSLKRQLPDGQWQRNAATQPWKIPKPFELGVLFGSVPERLMDYIYNNNPQAFKELPKSIANAIMPNWMPQAVAPIIEQFANRSIFLDRQLINKPLQEVRPEYQATPGTSEVGKIAGKWISETNRALGKPLPESFGSPIVIDNYIRQYTGGLGKHVTDMLDAGLRASGITPAKAEPPTKTWADMPGIKAFVSRFPTSQAESIKDFYEAYDERKQTKATEKYLRKEGQPEAAREIRTDDPTWVPNKIQKSLGDLNKRVHDAYVSDKLTPDQKREVIDTTYLQMIKLSQLGLKALDITEKRRAQ